MHSSAQTPGEDSQIAEKVRRERLHILFRQSFFATTAALLAALMFSWLNWEGAKYWGGQWDGERPGQRTILTWLALIGASTVLRYGVFLVYFRTGPAAVAPARWERLYWCTLVLSAGIWGGGALVIMDSHSLLSQTITLLFTIGMAGSAIASYSAYSSMTLSAIAVLLLPSAVWMVAQPTTIQRVMGLSAIIFSIAVARSSRVIADALETSLRLSHQMKLAHGAASRAAATDELTGLSNRRAFFERAEQLLSYARRTRQSACVMVMDIDHFKSINDTHGHQAGDEVLRKVGLLLAGQFRDADVCGRLGGEEFAVFLVGPTGGEAREIAEKLRCAVEGVACEVHALRITASIGLAAHGFAAPGPDDEDLLSLLQHADKAMYQAKAGGRNRVAIAGGEDEGGGRIAAHERS